MAAILQDARYPEEASDGAVICDDKRRFLRPRAAPLFTLTPAVGAPLPSCVYTDTWAGGSEQWPNHLQLPATASAVCLWLLRD